MEGSNGGYINSSLSRKKSKTSARWTHGQNKYKDPQNNKTSRSRQAKLIPTWGDHLSPLVQIEPVNLVTIQHLVMHSVSTNNQYGAYKWDQINPTDLM